MARLPRKVREINDFNATDWFEKLLQRTTTGTPEPQGSGVFFGIMRFVALSACRGGASE